jgi:hypothetical protein
MSFKFFVCCRLFDEVYLLTHASGEMRTVACTGIRFYHSICSLYCGDVRRVVWSAFTQTCISLSLHRLIS